MKILIAEDDQFSSRLLAVLLEKWGYEVIRACDGREAWRILESEDAPPLAILDWMMPELSGPDVCRKVRQSAASAATYIILLTARGQKADIIAGLNAGADDYVTKPFDREELHARLQVGRRVLGLQQNLAERVRELENALSYVRQLQGLLPICSYCKKIRDDRHEWQPIEGYLVQHSQAEFSHSICPECYQRHREELEG